MRRLAFLTVVVTGLLAVAAAAVARPAGSVSGTSAAAKHAVGSAIGSVEVKLDVNRFVKSGRQLVAEGTAVATYTPVGGEPTVVRQPFRARVMAGGKRSLSGLRSRQEICQVLTLQLDQLSLDLLGLHVDLSKVVLTITADSQGGILGRLFCSVTNSKKLASASTARSLTKVARRSGLSSDGVGFGVPTRQTQALGPGPCSIVDLLLGPLHLNLLGLIVDLN
jgi:hypothetical protein